MMRTKPTKVWKTKDEWSAVNAKAVASGSEVQMPNVLEMALQDLLTLHDAIEHEIAPWFEKKPIDAPIRFR